ncbi:unnamed protein product [Heligmosomoides polygyrus]|uniref:Trafficking protein particle complex subunit n=1 Tax=Heligmosomoides polygyrus TaxID=6339 RepID=A0A183G3P9_HELPZ|nr:unnamed protein product [Heligmosomoides polygyrus]
MLLTLCYFLFYVKVIIGNPLLYFLRITGNIAFLTSKSIMIFFADTLPSRLIRSRARPTEPTFQERLRFYGVKCHEAVTTIRQARHEFAALMQDKRDLFTRRGGAFHYLVKIRKLHSTHSQRRSVLVTATEFFVMSHEWYEILVAADEAEESSRLDFINLLCDQVFIKPTEPGDKDYPEPASVQKSYICRDVVDMMRYQLIQFDVLLDEEKRARSRRGRQGSQVKNGS